MSGGGTSGVRRSGGLWGQEIRSSDGLESGDHDSGLRSQGSGLIKSGIIRKS